MFVCVCSTHVNTRPGLMSVLSAVNRLTSAGFLLSAPSRQLRVHICSRSHVVDGVRRSGAKDIPQRAKPGKMSRKQRKSPRTPWTHATADVLVS